jgi:RecB family exonuclease
MLLITIFVELRVVAGRSRTRAGSPKAVLCRGLEKNGMVRAGHGRGMASVNQTRPHCVNQMRKAHSKPLAARHGRGTAWARHAMCESAFKHSRIAPEKHSDFTPTLNTLAVNLESSKDSLCLYILTCYT